jgi:hypothetical protein
MCHRAIGSNLIEIESQPDRNYTILQIVNGVLDRKCTPLTTIAQIMRRNGSFEITKSSIILTRVIVSQSLSRSWWSILVTEMKSWNAQKPNFC